MKAIASIVAVTLAAGALWAGPARVLVGPLCEATKGWSQDATMNVYTRAACCGCDPLAWGQILVYHALNHGTPAADWVPPERSGTVIFKGKAEARTTLLREPFDWVAVRDRTTATRADGETETPVARLMWDFGVIGNATYTDDLALATVNEERFKDYTGFAEGYRYSQPRDYGVVPDYWEGMLRRLLRVSLQVGAPLCAGIYTTGANMGHMIVVDGWGVDADGTEYFHVNYGWGGTQGYGWWDWETARTPAPYADHGFRTLYANVFPTALGSVVVGRVASAGQAPLSGASVTLTHENGTVWTATTDANGLYAFTDLPLVDTKGLYTPTTLPKDAYTVTVAAAGYVAQTQNVSVEGFIDDDLRLAKQNEWEAAQGKDGGGKGDGSGEPPVPYPLAFGGAVADFTLEPIAPIVLDTPAQLANLAQYAGKTVHVATGTYALAQTLVVPAGVTLVGGYNPATGVTDPLATPTRLVPAAGLYGTLVRLGEGATLDGFFLVDANAQIPLFVEPADDAKTQVAARNCVFSGGRNNYMGNMLAATCCVFLNKGAQDLPGGIATHCTFAGTLDDGSDGGGNLTGVGAASRPAAPTTCDAGHDCPAYGLDGRPLGGNLGALAPDGFDFEPAAAKAPGYRLRLN